MKTDGSNATQLTTGNNNRYISPEWTTKAVTSRMRVVVAMTHPSVIDQILANRRTRAAASGGDQAAARPAAIAPSAILANVRQIPDRPRLNLLSRVGNARLPDFTARGFCGEQDSNGQKIYGTTV